MRPLPSSPHWAPTTAVTGIVVSPRRASGVARVLGDGRAVDVLEHDEGPAFGRRAGVVQACDVRVLQRGQQLAFTRKDGRATLLVADAMGWREADVASGAVTMRPFDLLANGSSAIAATSIMPLALRAAGGPIITGACRYSTPPASSAAIRAAVRSGSVVV